MVSVLLTGRARGYRVFLTAIEVFCIICATSLDLTGDCVSSKNRCFKNCGKSIYDIKDNGAARI